MKQVEILKGALAKLERDGWGRYVYGGAGEESCVMGACRYAAHTDRVGLARLSSFKGEKKIAGVLAKAAGLKRRRVTQSWWTRLVEWNDDGKRTADQVTRVLRKAIRTLKAR